MSTSRYSELIARLLRQHSPTQLEHTEALAQRGVGTIERAMTARVRTRRRVRRAGASALVAACIVAGAAWGLRRGNLPASLAWSRDASMVAGSSSTDARLFDRGGVSSSLAEGQRIEPGSRVATFGGGQSELLVTTGTKLDLHDNSDLSIVEMGRTERFSLGTGALRAEVAKLRPGERFILDTPDAEIEVHGTSFLVELAARGGGCLNGPATSVTVYEGVVTVRFAGEPEAKVVAGQRWPATCARPTDEQARNAGSAPIATSAEPPRSDAVGALVRAAPGHPLAKTALTPAVTTTLGLQNKMFADAIAADGRGDWQGALAGFDHLAQQFPSSLLLESALAEKMKILKSHDRGRAREAAAQYLRSYPRGFARRDAEAIVSDAP